MSEEPHRPPFPPPGAPTLRGARLLLRPLRDEDLEAVFGALSNPRVIAHYGVHYDSLEATRAQMDWFARIEQEGSGRWWALCRPQAPQILLGACGFNDRDALHQRMELGYWLLPQHWGQGLMSEALALALDHGFGAMGAHRIEAVVEPENRASGRLLERLGFRMEGLRRECERRQRGSGPDWISLCGYGLLAHEWPTTAPKDGPAPTVD